MTTISSFSTSNARTWGELFSDAASGLGDMLTGAVDAVAGAVGATVNHAPTAIGAVANAASEAVSGINGAVADFSTGISAPVSAASNPFAGLDLGGAVAGFMNISASSDGPGMASLGDMTSQLANMNVQRSQGASMSL